MTNEEIFPLYVALWRRLPTDELWVHYGPGSSRREAGYFQHDGQGGFKRPEIVIVRAYYAEPEDEPSMVRSNGRPVDLVAEMCTLAHEYGHYLSFSGATSLDRWREYHRAVLHVDELLDKMTARHCYNPLTHRDRLRRRLSGREKALIVAEETIAWQLGRQFVPEPLHEDYDRRAPHGVHCHKFRMGLDPLWPEDAPQRGEG
jgi:hypothetical protein